MADRPAVAQSAGRRHRQHASRRDLRRQAVLARLARPGRLGLRRIPRLRDGAGCAHGARAAIAGARADRVVLRASRRRAHACAGAPRCTTASCCRISCGRISSACSPISSAPVTNSIPRGSRRSANFVFRCSARVEHGGVRLELRHALEPWHVLGEETVSGATSRPGGFIRRTAAGESRGARSGAPRHRLQRPPRAACATGRSGEFVAGVRFKAAMLPVSLHPNLPVNAPLTFDIIDTWSKRSLGGCVYHAQHPGGMSYDGLSGECRRGRGAAPRALSGFRPHAGRRRCAGGRAVGRISDDARSAAAARHRSSRQPFGENGAKIPE